MEREDRVEPRLNPPSANRKAVINRVNIEERRYEVESATLTVDKSATTTADKKVGGVLEKIRDANRNHESSW